MAAVKPTGRKKSTAAWEKGGVVVERESMGEYCLRYWQKQKHLLSWGGKKTSVDKATVLDWLCGTRSDACDVMPSCAMAMTEAAARIRLAACFLVASLLSFLADVSPGLVK